MPDDPSHRGGLGMLGVAMAACCGLPLLLGAGVAVGTLGVAVGSAAVLLAGVALAAWGWRRRQDRSHNGKLCAGRPGFRDE